MVFKKNLFLILLLTYFIPLQGNTQSLISRYQVGDQKEFWVWDLSIMPPGFRKINATALYTGTHSYIFVENILVESVIQKNDIEVLSTFLEKQGEIGSREVGLGILPFIEKHFAPLPTKMHTDPRVVILLTDLGQFGNHSFDGFFNFFDQLTEVEAWQNHQQHSNEENIVYIQAKNLPFDTHHTLSILSHEIVHLVDRKPHSSWVSELFGEASMLLAGYFTDQIAVNRFASHSWTSPLVSESYVHYGTLTLFASFLIDEIEEIVKLNFFKNWLESEEGPQNFLLNKFSSLPSFQGSNFHDIYKKFVRYVVFASENEQILPFQWNFSPQSLLGIKIPKIHPAFSFTATSSAFEGEIMPYAFAIFDLAQYPNPLTNRIQLELLEFPSNSPNSSPVCQEDFSLDYEIIGSKLYVYAFGCRYGDKQDLLKYRISVYSE